MYWKDLLKSIKLNDSQYDVPKIKQAYETAAAAHKGQLRKSGEPYISHPVAVAVILADLGMDTESVVAALLHDVVEDTEISIDNVRKQFGEETAHLVSGMTKLSKFYFYSREEHQAENVRKMLIAMARDVRVVIIKLADRLHNMRTLEYVEDAQKQRDTALETMEIYAPIAQRLGIWTVKDELEDISLRYLDPVAYEEIAVRLRADEQANYSFIDSIKTKIDTRLSEYYKGFFIEGRIKSMYSTYRKHYVQNRSYDEIYDIFAIRIIVSTVNECYNILGEIHDMFRPIPSRFKDYISTPKVNMYRSLHTTVFDKSSIPFEVQIRTWEMHHTAEYGIAAHWKYKIGLQTKDSLDEKVAWIRQLLESQKESVDSREILGSIKSDLTSEEVYVYTPKGDVIILPAGATVIDFAYAIHTQVGNRMTGAKIDGRMVALDTVLQTGTIINILTSSDENHGPSRDWINIARASSTRNKIRGWFKKERREENIQQGRSELEREFKRNNILLSPEDLKPFIKRIARSQRLNTPDEFLATIGYGGISLTRIMPQIKDLYTKEYKEDPEEELRKQLEKYAAQKPRKASGSVIVEGIDSCLVKFSKCCSPLPGDDIIGYITRGYGVSIHKRDCVNVESSLSDPDQHERWLNCSWASHATKEVFKSTIDIHCRDRSGLLVDVSIALNNMRVPVYALTATEQPSKDTIIQITLGIASLDQLNNILKTLYKIRGIERVERTLQ